MLNEKDFKMTEFEMKCYGMSEADIREQYMESITAKCSGLEMVVMSILSDAQEILAFQSPDGWLKPVSPRDADTARKQMNIAKFILTEMMTSKETV